VIVSIGGGYFSRARCRGNLLYILSNGYGKMIIIIKSIGVRIKYLLEGIVTDLG
jgi:hypothetical protein